MLIGIDNGVSGGVCVLSDSGQIVDMAALGLKCPPTRLMPSNGQPTHESNPNALRGDLGPSTRQIDPHWLVWWIKDVTQDKPCPIVVEECPEHSQSKSSMRSMGISFGLITGAILAKLPDYPLHTVRSGNPRDSWQKQLGVYEAGRTKERALELANELWPDEKWILTRRARKPHTGVLDAALMAWHLHQQQTTK
jgi:hypothetical protein